MNLYFVKKMKNLINKREIFNNKNKKYFTLYVFVFLRQLLS
jgi:hypothetical protein